MKRYRKGNDLFFLWAISLNGAPLDLSGKVTDCYIKSQYGQIIAISNLSIAGNKITGVFSGAAQRAPGYYYIVLYLCIDGARYSLDHNFVKLVCHTFQEGGENCESLIVSNEPF